MDRPPTRILRRAGAAGALAALLVAFLATPAAAHASLLESSPAPGAVLQATPELVSLSFSEPVDASFGAIRVHDADGIRVDDGEVKTRNNLVTLPLDPLEDGSYVVTFRVTSRDSHPVTGAFAFQVGAAGNASSPKTQALAQELLSSERGDRVVGAVYGISRGLLFAGLALMIGCVAFGLVVWSRARAVARNRRLVWLGWTMATFATALGVLVYGPYAAGAGLGDMFDTALMEQTLDTRYGQVGLARLVLLALGAPILWFVLGRDGEEPRHLPRPWLGAVVVFGVLVAATPGLAGHASAGELVELAVVTDTLHVLAMACWLGGLATLAAVVLRKQWSMRDIEGPVTRWSRFALGCVAVIIATGAFQTWRQVGNLTALRSTEFGRMLIVKLVLFATLLMLAVFSRESVRSLWPAATTRLGRRVPVVAGGADDGAEPVEAAELTRLRRSAWGEVLVAVLVLAVTALLVNAPPAKSAAEDAEGNAVGVTLKASDVWVDVVVVPGERGRNAVHVSALTPKGKVKDVEELTITFDLPEEGIEGLEVPLEDISPGHYTANGFALPVDGTWQVTATVVSELTPRTIRSEIEIDDE